ncbi:CRO1 protein [Phakopsora pachyrhizi]|uniref:CRO1 protein n=1 Tax=Phakopsora pachyrhizi TaxID=170000 RepID=A0AAV0AN18_PHAPC|nr:CRO1 protein [Phakopsora pachyrhizi]
MANQASEINDNVSLENVTGSVIASPSSKQTDESIKTVIEAVNSSEPVIRAKAFSALALLLRHQSHTKSWLLRPIEALVQSTDVEAVCQGLAGLSAVFQLSPNHGLEILKSEGFLPCLVDSVMDLLDLVLEKKTKSDLTRSLTDFLALLMNHKVAREAVSNDWPGCIDWLSRLTLATTTNISIPVRCGASLALIKLRLAADSADSIKGIPSLTCLTEVLIKALIGRIEPLNTAVEGLALVSRKPAIRLKLMEESKSLLAALKAIMTYENDVKDSLPTFQDTSIAYGIVALLFNLSSYNPMRSEEDEVKDRLRKLANRDSNVNQSKKIVEIDEDEDLVIEDDKIAEWIQSALNDNNNLMELVDTLVKTESKEVKRTSGKVLLILVARQQCRGKFLQAGGGRMIMKIVASITIPSSKTEIVVERSNSKLKTDFEKLETEDLPVIQALAKILITTNPLLIFGPSSESPLLLSTIRPLNALFVHPSATLLQIFESLMALTNLSSFGPKIATEVASSPRLLIRLEECMVGIRTGENEMVRRAATELLCNISTTEPVLSSFTPHQFKSQVTASEGLDPIGTRLHLLTALSSSDDLQTALAASGALATLAQCSTNVSKALFSWKTLAECLQRVAIDIIEEGKVGVQLRMVTLLGSLISEMTSDRLEGFLFASKLIETIKNSLEKLGDEEEQCREVKRLTELLLDEIEKRSKIEEIK